MSTADGWVKPEVAGSSPAMGWRGKTNLANAQADAPRGYALATSKMDSSKPEISAGRQINTPSRFDG